NARAIALPCPAGSCGRGALGCRGYSRTSVPGVPVVVAAAIRPPPSMVAPVEGRPVVVGPPVAVIDRRSVDRRRIDHPRRDGRAGEYRYTRDGESEEEGHPGSRRPWSRQGNQCQERSREDHLLHALLKQRCPPSVTAPPPGAVYGMSRSFR